LSREEQSRQEKGREEKRGEQAREGERREERRRAEKRRGEEGREKNITCYMQISVGSRLLLIEREGRSIKVTASDQLSQEENERNNWAKHARACKYLSISVDRCQHLHSARLVEGRGLQYLQYVHIRSVSAVLTCTL
jgi:hypothetical protein